MSQANFLDSCELNLACKLIAVAYSVVQEINKYSTNTNMEHKFKEEINTRAMDFLQDTQLANKCYKLLSDIITTQRLNLMTLGQDQFELAPKEFRQMPCD